MMQDEKLAQLEKQFKFHRHTGTDSVDLGFPEKLTDAPLSSITSPSGGATVDTQARTAIDLIITRLEDLGLINTN